METLINRTGKYRQNSDLLECLLSNVINMVHRQIVHCWQDPLEKEWQSSPVFMPTKSHGLKSFARVGHDLATKQQNAHLIKTY